MKPFAYVVPATASEAARVVAETDGATFLAGGTNLVDLMKLGVIAPHTLVDVTQVLDATIEPTPEGGVRIGAAALNSDIAAASQVRAAYPAVAEALLAGASGQLRNRASAAGNLLQRTRCLYFQDVAKPCNKRSRGSGCSARGGEHRNLGILGTSEACIATHPSDFAVALAAYDALVHVVGPEGERTIPLLDVYRPPGAEPDVETVLARGELITTIELPPPGALRSRYRKVRDRASYAFALVSAAVAVDSAAGDVRIALGGVAPAPWRAARAEEALREQDLRSADLGAALAREMELARPLPGNAFKVSLAGRVAVGLLEELAA